MDWGTGRRIENASEGITLQIEKKAESDGALNAYIYLIMDAQLNIAHNSMYKSRGWVWTDPEVIPIEPGTNLYYWIEKISNLLAGDKLYS